MNFSVEIEALTLVMEKYQKKSKERDYKLETEDMLHLN